MSLDDRRKWKIVRCRQGRRSSPQGDPPWRHHTLQVLYYYGARWRSWRRQPDPALGRFAQPDTLVPQPGNPLAWDRYAYTLNNPVRYTDPSGYMVAEPGGPRKWYNPYVILFQIENDSLSWSDYEKQTINTAALIIGGRFAQIINHESFLDYKTGLSENISKKVSAPEAFLGIFNGPVIFKKVCDTCAEYHMGLSNPPPGAQDYTCWGRHVGGKTIYTFKNASTKGISSVFQWGVHEIFHIFDKLTGYMGRGMASLYDRSIFDSGRWQQSVQIENYEIFADMGIAWTYSHWSSDEDVPFAIADMSEFMQKYVLMLYYFP